VIALGLSSLGRTVIGVDVAPAMLARAQVRLGAVLIIGDARLLPIADASMAHAVSVWVVQAVDPPEALFAEVARVLRPGSRYLVCPTNRIRGDDPMEPILHAMLDRATRFHPTWRWNRVGAADIARWAAPAGFVSRIETFESRSWNTTAAEQIDSINARAWPALHGLDADTFQAVTQPALEALHALSTAPITRRADVDIVVLELA
jgi:SAM-dependent methyltransferase